MPMMIAIGLGLGFGTGGGDPPPYAPPSGYHWEQVVYLGEPVVYQGQIIYALVGG